MGDELKEAIQKILDEKGLMKEIQTFENAEGNYVSDVVGIMYDDDEICETSINARGFELCLIYKDNGDVYQLLFVDANHNSLEDESNDNDQFEDNEDKLYDRLREALTLIKESTNLPG